MKRTLRKIKDIFRGISRLALLGASTYYIFYSLKNAWFSLENRFTYFGFALFVLALGVQVEIILTLICNWMILSRKEERRCLNTRN